MITEHYTRHRTAHPSSGANLLHSILEVEVNSVSIAFSDCEPNRGVHHLEEGL